MFEKQPAEFTQYTRFQHFTRCVHQKFCCAFTRMLAVKQGKIDWIDHETFPTRYYLIKRYQLLYLGITMKLTDDRSTMTINHEIQEQFIFFIDVFSAKFFWKMLGCLPILWIGNSIRNLLPTNLGLRFPSI